MMQMYASLPQHIANNRVDLTVEFVEGKAAKVVDINIIGNTVFKESDIEQAFAVKESSWSSIVTRNDRYAREKMAASWKHCVRYTLTKRLYQLQYHQL